MGCSEDSEFNSNVIRMSQNGYKLCHTLTFPWKDVREPHKIKLRSSSASRQKDTVLPKIPQFGCKKINHQMAHNKIKEKGPLLSGRCDNSNAAQQLSGKTKWNEELCLYRTAIILSNPHILVNSKCFPLSNCRKLRPTGSFSNTLRWWWQQPWPWGRQQLFCRARPKDWKTYICWDRGQIPLESIHHAPKRRCALYVGTTCLLPSSSAKFGLREFSRTEAWYAFALLLTARHYIDKKPK